MTIRAGMVYECQRKLGGDPYPVLVTVADYRGTGQALCKAITDGARELDPSLQMSLIPHGRLAPWWKA